MKRLNNIKRIFCTLIVAVLVLSLALPIFASYPKHESYIADSASVLAENTVRALRKSNETLKNDYGVVVAVCTVKTTENTPIAEYARAVFTEWKMGEGVLLLIVSEDQDYYIVQSTGLRDIITNDQLRLVRNDYLEPDFATGNIDRGVQKSATKLTSIIERGLQKKAQEDKENSKDEEGTATGKAIKSSAISSPRTTMTSVSTDRDSLRELAAPIPHVSLRDAHRRDTPRTTESARDRTPLLVRDRIRRTECTTSTATSDRTAPTCTTIPTEQSAELPEHKIREDSARLTTKLARSASPNSITEEDNPGDKI